MLRLLVTFALLVLNTALASSVETVIIKGHDFPTEETFSRKLKSEYDVIQKRWINIEDHEIQLEAYHLKKSDKSIPSEFTFEGPAKKHLFNKDNIKYIDYGIPLAFLTYGVFFWDWGGGVSGFNFIDEGWFGSNTYAGGVDKLSHMHSHYVIDRAVYYFYRRSGISHDESLKSAYIMASLLGLLVEVGDGFSHYGFSLNDIIANQIGATLGHILNQNAYLDELIGFQMRWWKENSPSSEGSDPLGDYNNEKFVFNVRMAAIPTLRDFIGTRYLNMDLGYYARGFKTTDPHEEKVRTLFVGASINMGQLIHDLFPKSEFAYGVSAVTRYYQLPYTSVEIKSWDIKD